LTSKTPLDVAIDAEWLVVERYHCGREWMSSFKPGALTMNEA
jgi:hypothetical protein